MWHHPGVIITRIKVLREFRPEVLGLKTEVTLQVWRCDLCDFWIHANFCPFQDLCYTSTWMIEDEARNLDEITENWVWVSLWNEWQVFIESFLLLGFARPWIAGAVASAACGHPRVFYGDSASLWLMCAGEAPGWGFVRGMQVVGQPGSSVVFKK